VAYDRVVRGAHAVVAAVVCVALPLVSWLDGGFLAWTMYSGSGSYRLEIVAVSAGGSRRALAPTELARHMGVEERPYLAAADTWRMIPSRGLRLRLAEVGALACRLRPAEHVEITLFARRTLDAPAEPTFARVPCDDTRRGSVVP
jgi:hypothetical protein